MGNDRRNNENWARPEAQRREMQDMHRMRRDDIPTGRRDGTAAPPPRRNAPSKQRGSVLRARIIMYLIVFAVLLLLSAGIFTACFFSTPDKIGSDMKFVYEKASVKVDEKNAYRGGRLYVSFTRIADIFQMTRTGDASEAHFVLVDERTDAAGTGKEEYVTFEKDSACADVSGSLICMSGECFFLGDEVYVPADFVTNYMSGITVTEDTDARKVTVAREMTAVTDEDGDFIPAEAHFLLGASHPPERIDIGDAAYDPDSVTFVSDLSAYEGYMDPENAEPYLVLVNRDNTVDKSHAPTNLVNVINTRNDRAAQQMVECAAKALEALYIEMKAAGYTDVSVTSAYRSYDYQKQLYSSYVAREKAANPSLTDAQARARADAYSAREGTSEHQTGLCCDMHNLGEADVAFAEKEAYAWLKQNAWKFGFIERFPKDKTEITGYSFEPWHYRFVGRKAAAEIASRGLCLEEYLKERA